MHECAERKNTQEEISNGEKKSWIHMLKRWEENANFQ